MKRLILGAAFVLLMAGNVAAQSVEAEINSLVVTYGDQEFKAGVDCALQAAAAILGEGLSAEEALESLELCRTRHRLEAGLLHLEETDGL